MEERVKPGQSRKILVLLWRGITVGRSVGRCADSFTLPCKTVCEQKLESVAQSHHVRVLILLQFVALRDDLDRPAIQRRLQSGLEAEVEVTGVLRVDAESVHGPRGIGHGVCRQPFF